MAIKLPLQIITEYVQQLEANLSSVQERCTELLESNRALKGELCTYKAALKEMRTVFRQIHHAQEWADFIEKYE